MKSIGGYFELELPETKCDFIHSDCVMLNSGRHAFEYILQSCRNELNKVWLPYYTCNVMLEPFERIGIEWEFYHIDSNLEIPEIPIMGEKDKIVVNNYFGIKDEYILNLAKDLKDRIIIDNAQAWYASEIPNVSSFFSPRKFFGLPDGGCASRAPKSEMEISQDTSYDRMSHLLKRIDLGSEGGYGDFRSNSAKLRDIPVRSMSNLTHRLLSSIDFDLVKSKRRRNYKILSKELDSINKLRLPTMDSFACPMVYPYYTEDTSLRQKLIYNKIFVATYWPNVFDWCDETSVEYKLAKNIIPLPIDQRYGEEEMKYIISKI